MYAARREQHAAILLPNEVNISNLNMKQIESSFLFCFSCAQRCLVTYCFTFSFTLNMFTFARLPSPNVVTAAV